jgi:hypothetical protein
MTLLRWSAAFLIVALFSALLPPADAGSPVQYLALSLPWILIGCSAILAVLGAFVFRNH